MSCLGWLVWGQGGVVCSGAVWFLGSRKEENIAMVHSTAQGCRIK